MTTEPKDAMRDADGRAVFVRDDGSYSETFPPENIVRRSGEHEAKYRVFGFVGNDREYTEVTIDVDPGRIDNGQTDALSVASALYGSSISVGDLGGEIFEVEVHEVPRSEPM